MWTLIWRTIKDRRIIISVYVAASIALLWMYVAFFPAIKDQSANLEQLLQSYPESMMKAFNFDIKSLNTLEGFIATEQFSFVWPLLVIFMLLGYSGSAIAGEIEKGTIEILLSQPLSRLKLYFGRYLSGLLMLVLFTIFSIFAIFPIASLYDISLKTSHFLNFSILAFLFGLSIFSIGMFLSSVFSDRGKVFFIAGLFLVLMYVLNIIAAIRESLTDLKYASFFFYFNPSLALIYNKIDDYSYVVFLSVIVVFTLLGAIIFSKRDIAV